MKEIIKIPTYAKITKGSWSQNGYGKVWCKIREINCEMRHMALSHPEYKKFAWVDIDDCIFK